MRALLGRWAFLIIGGALLTPYVLLGVVLFSVGSSVSLENSADMLRAQVLVLAGTIPALVVTGWVPVIRALSAAVARQLLGVHLTPARSATWADRWRTGLWLTAHLILGGVMSALTLSVPPACLVLLGVPLLGEQASRDMHLWGYEPAEWGSGTAPLAGLAGLAALAALVAGAGWLLARLAPVLLGPSAAEKLAEAERRAERLAQRNQLARDLHDSVGHALSIVTVQAGAAGHVLDADPEFARRALAAIEDTARAALTDLDQVLGLLREDHDDQRGTQPGSPDLGALPDLLDRTRLAGVSVTLDLSGDLSGLPEKVSREAYRIVQECLTNVLRHAGQVPAALRLAPDAEGLLIVMTNPLGPGTPVPSGGRGLRGIAERARTLRGRSSAGLEGELWRVEVWLPR
ncbi:sensor histidine kinase [Longispora albida]|uniref:sensor histidine kinase n=1 Tax=Longispora albida TaxID=203523 RepID=UPI001B7FE52F|nr:histidine kinase [Longispora albida]